MDANLNEYGQDRIPQSKVMRSCTLVSLRDKKQYDFNSFIEADAFLNKKHGYVGGVYKNGSRAVKLHTDGTKEFFDIIPGDSHKVRYSTPAKQEQLCWTCGNCYGGCSWSRSYTPVKGWTAKESIKGAVKTYLILKCPEYVNDREKK